MWRSFCQVELIYLALDGQCSRPFPEAMALEDLGTWWQRHWPRVSMVWALPLWSSSWGAAFNPSPMVLLRPTTHSGHSLGGPTELYLTPAHIWAAHCDKYCHGFFSSSVSVHFPQQSGLGHTSAPVLLNQEPASHQPQAQRELRCTVSLVVRKKDKSFTKWRDLHFCFLCGLREQLNHWAHQCWFSLSRVAGKFTVGVAARHCQGSSFDGGFSMTERKKKPYSKQWEVVWLSPPLSPCTAF